MEKLRPFIAEASSAPVQQAAAEQPKAEPAIIGPEEGKSTAPKETPDDIVNVELTGYTAEGKLRVIKEYRALAGLGLKEAKAKVEAGPFMAFKSMKRSEAEELIKKFDSYGAKMKIY